MGLRKRVWLNTPWHNYADRKKVLVDETNYQDFNMYEEDNTHFNHGDGINSSCVTITSEPLILRRPNYLLIFKGEKIESRWYVMNLQFMSGEPTGGATNKWQVTLLRDIVIDRRADIARSESVKTIRGRLPDVWSELMVNPEGMTTNDILQREIELKDNFGFDWYTIYYDANNPISLSTQTTEPPNMRFTWAQLSAAFTFAQGESLQQTDGNITTIDGRNMRRRLVEYFDVRFNAAYLRSENMAFNVNIGTYTVRYIASRNASGNITGYSVQVLSDVVQTWTQPSAPYPGQTWQPRGQALVAAQSLAGQNGGSNIQTGVISATQSGEMDYRGTIDPVIDIYNNNFINIDNNATFFTVTRPGGTAADTTSDVTNGLLQASFTGSVLRGGMVPNSQNLNTFLALEGPTLINYNVFTEVFIGSGNRVTNAINFTLPGGNVLDEVVVGCITIPVSDGMVANINGSGAKEISSGSVKRLVTGGVTASAGRDSIYAIEKLPYCPIPSLAQFYNANTKTLTIPTGSAVANLIQPMTDVGGSSVWWGFRVQTASTEFIIDLPANDPALNPTSDYKRRAMTESVKLCSPNHTSQMVINPVANQGLRRIRIQTTLRPNGTFYRWQPEFGGLHGFSTKDDRGIIQEGGFSIPIVTNAYIEFTRTNSMYREIFNTEVQFMESNNNIGRTSEIMNAGHQYNKAIRSADFDQQMAMASAGMGMAGSALGMIGGLASGNPLAMAGGALGMMKSGMNLWQAGQRGDFSRNEAGIDYDLAKANIGLNDGLRANSIAQKAALFDFDIATIKNRPNTVSQTSILNVNNRGNAYIQIFSCTVQERANVERYITMMGMSIERFGGINDYLIGDNCYIEAVVQFLPGSTPIELIAINSELSRGVYVQEGLFAAGGA